MNESKLNADFLEEVLFWREENSKWVTLLLKSLKDLNSTLWAEEAPGIQ
jgi:hypothetical protein